jgi:hypothetical protein
MVSPARIAAAGFTLAAVAALGGVATPAAPAQAAINTYVWNDVRGYVLMYAVPHEGTNPRAYPDNGTKFDMRCWQDQNGFRWFWGQEFETGEWGYIRAQWVYNQVSVKGC